MPKCTKWESCSQLQIQFLQNHTVSLSIYYILKKISMISLYFWSTLKSKSEKVDALGFLGLNVAIVKTEDGPTSRSKNFKTPFFKRY